MHGAGRLFAVLAVAQAAPPDAPPTWSRTEVEAMAPEAVARRLLGDGAANVLPMWESRGSGPAVDAPLRLLMFRSVGRSSSLAGLCAADQIQIRFAPAGPIQGAATRVRTDRSWSSPIFYLVESALAATPAAVPAAARPAADAACRAIDPRRIHIFLSPDPDLLARALGIVTQAAAAARAGTATAPLDCAATGWEGHAPLDTRQCSALIAGIDLERVDSAAPCPGAEPWRCTIVEIGLEPGSGPIDRIEVRIEDGGPGLPPARLAVGRIAPPPMN
ncbi:MAG TPA: hypothetical protein VIT38_09230 [Allosphingosinicella sp.]